MALVQKKLSSVRTREGINHYPKTCSIMSNVLFSPAKSLSSVHRKYSSPVIVIWKVDKGWDKHLSDLRHGQLVEFLGRPAAWAFQRVDKAVSKTAALCSVWATALTEIMRQRQSKWAFWNVIYLRSPSAAQRTEPLFQCIVNFGESSTFWA